jgi:hypothetical protein
MYTAQGEYICNNKNTKKSILEKFLVDTKPNESNSLLEYKKSCELVCDIENDKLAYQQINLKHKCIKDKICNK